MTNKHHRSINDMRQSFLIAVLSLWLVLTIVASAFVMIADLELPALLIGAGLCALPVLSTFLVVWRGMAWPRGRRAAFVCLPWILAGASFVAVSGGLSSPALIFVAFPALFALAFGWKRLAVETAVFSVIATLAAIWIAPFVSGMPGTADLARASEMFSFAGLCLIPFIVAGLVAAPQDVAVPDTATLKAKAVNDDQPLATAGLDPIGKTGANPQDGSDVTIIDVSREGRVRSVSGDKSHGLDLRPGRVFIDAFPEENRRTINMRVKSGGFFTEKLSNGPTLELTVDRHETGIRVFVNEAESASEVVQSDPAADARIRAAEQALMERTAFFAGLGHDLKTPLNAILGFSDLMRSELRGPLTDAYKEYSQLIHESGQDLLLIVEDILDYAKAEAGHARVELEPVDLVASGESVVAQLGAQATRAGVTLRILADKEVWAMADARAVRQIWQNLISNAVKYSESGGVVTLDARTGNGAVALSVRDTGAGMDADDLDRIAKPFQQGRNSKGRAGTGLGLAVVQKFADQMKGRVIIDTAPGAGTRVRVILPQALDQDTVKTEEAAE